MVARVLGMPGICCAPCGSTRKITFAGGLTLIDPQMELLPPVGRTSMTALLSLLNMPTRIAGTMMAPTVLPAHCPCLTSICPLAPNALREVEKFISFSKAVLVQTSCGASSITDKISGPSFPFTPRASKANKDAEIFPATLVCGPVRLTSSARRPVKSLDNRMLQFKPNPPSICAPPFQSVPVNPLTLSGSAKAYFNVDAGMLATSAELNKKMANNENQK